MNIDDCKASQVKYQNVKEKIGQSKSWHMLVSYTFQVHPFQNDQANSCDILRIHENSDELTTEQELYFTKLLQGRLECSSLSLSSRVNVKSGLNAVSTFNDSTISVVRKRIGF
jgi:hypothetical protein